MTTANPDILARDSQCAPASRRSRLLAWGVHALTMSGLVFASLAMLSVIHNEIRWMWLWLALAMIVDGVDGTCARRARVKEVIPWFDGGVLDILIDYLTWTFIPALFMYLWLPMGPKPVAGALMILVLVSSTFCYANEGEKSTDNYFVGFPAAWNIVAVMMWVLALPGWLNIALAILLSVLTLVPTHYVHPARVTRFRTLNIAAVGVWLVGTVWLVIVAFVACVLLMCLARPAADFTATRPKKFWLVALGASLLVFVWPYVMPLYLPLHGILQWVALILAIYYVGPERRRMGKSRGWGRGGGRGDSGW